MPKVSVGIAPGLLFFLRLKGVNRVLDRHTRDVIFPSAAPPVKLQTVQSAAAHEIPIIQSRIQSRMRSGMLLKAQKPRRVRQPTG